jgi:hypothetical protein
MRLHTYEDSDGVCDYPQLIILVRVLLTSTSNATSDSCECKECTSALVHAAAYTGNWAGKTRKFSKGFEFSVLIIFRTNIKL